ncbi:MAG: type II toxin-antitoxin system HicB family antitoxin [candidate division NC10 bacterium]|jgi:predicted RNase H-like HicB family nuclease
MELWQIPPETLSRYEKAALEAARFERLDDGSWYAQIPGFTGVWPNSDTQDTCRGELREVLKEWLALTLRDGDDDILVLAGIDLRSIAAWCPSPDKRRLAS